MSKINFKMWCVFN